MANGGLDVGKKGALNIIFTGAFCICLISLSSMGKEQKNNVRSHAMKLIIFYKDSRIHVSAPLSVHPMTATLAAVAGMITSLVVLRDFR
jgi:hypothetical protein